MDQTVTTCQQKDQRGVCKWLMWLLIVNIISLTYATLAKIINFGEWNNWLMSALSAGVLFCLFKLRHEHKFYVVAVVFLSIEFVCTVLWRMVFRSGMMFRYFVDLFQIDDPTSLLRIVSKVREIGEFCGVVGFFFELLAHHSLMKNVNRQLSNCWLWLSVAVLVLYILMQVLTLVVMDMHEKGILNITMYQQVYPLLNLPGKLAKITHVILLFLTGRAFGINQGVDQKKKKGIILSLIAGGVTLICLSVLLALHEMSTISIIGGADWPTFQYVFADRNGGLYSDLACFGVMALVSALIMGIVHKKRK